MNQIIIIHGMPDKEEYLGDLWPSPSNAHWIPWLQKELSRKEVLSQAPEMPRPYELNYQEWLDVFEQFKISNKTTLIGHSCGGGFLLRYLSEHPEINPKKVILVAPWIDPEPHELEEGNDFFKFKIDEDVVSRTSLHVMYSTDDLGPCIRSAEIIRIAIPNATYHVYTDKGHFTEPDLGDKAFPELFELIK